MNITELRRGYSVAELERWYAACHPKPHEPFDWAYAKAVVIGMCVWLTALVIGAVPLVWLGWLIVHWWKSSSW
jgi:hypothetical protein